MKKKKQVFFQPAQTEEEKKKRIRNRRQGTKRSEEERKHKGKNKDLSQSSIFDKAEVEALAEQVVDYINEENFDGLKEMAVDEMSSIMNKERMDEAKARVSEDWGEFQSITNITTTEVTQRGVTAALAYVTADYENAEIRYTFAFDEDMKLASLGIQ